MHADTERKNNFFRSKEKITRISETAFILSFLSACGGGGTSSEPSKKANGVAFDGYIQDGRVFRDINGNNKYDFGENYATTDEKGYFSGLLGDPQYNLVIDDNNAQAIDVVSGFPLGTIMSAPGDYSVISPITTLIVGLRDAGHSEEVAVRMVKQTLDLHPDLDLRTYDPFSFSNLDADGTADGYKATSVQIANILMASDQDFSGFSVDHYEIALANFAKLIHSKFEDNQLINLDSVQDLTVILPNVASSLVQELADAHAAIN